MPELPAADGPFVEVAPGTWVRAGAVLAVAACADHDRREPRDAGHPLHRREHLADVIVAGGSDDPARWRSPYTPAQLREALRLAAHAEDLRLLRLLEAGVRLAAPSHRRTDDDGV